MDLSIPHPRHCPSAEEIKSGKTEIENLERRIGDLEVRIRALQSELRDAQRKKKNCQSYIAPLRRLPVEIMVEIVHLCRHNGTSMRDMSQSCGYLRDIIIGIPRIWSEIYLLPDFRHVLPNGAKGNPCGSPQYLELLLTRAQGSPLNLYLECPIRAGLLRIISSRNCIIQSLTFDHPKGALNDTTLDLSSLNTSSLNQLNLVGTGPQTSMKIMNLALQSSSQDFTLGLNIRPFSIVKVLQHELLKRTVHLNFPCADFIMSVFVTIPLPRLHTLNVRGHPELFTVLVPSNLHELEFVSTERNEALLPGSLPAHAHRMALAGVSFKTETLSRNYRQTFSMLTYLEIHDARIEGNLQQYFNFPDLKELHIYDTMFADQADGYLVHKPLNGDLFQHTPKLESLSFFKLEVGERLMDGLQSCPLLRHLKVQCCEAITFISSLTMSLRSNAEIFPNLQVLNVEETWPRRLDITFEEFVTICTTKRPHLRVSGNGSAGIIRGPRVVGCRLDDDWEEIKDRFPRDITIDMTHNNGDMSDPGSVTTWQSHVV